MHLRDAESEKFERLLSKIDKNGTDALRAEASFVRQQLELHRAYVNACVKIETFADALRESSAPLVPLRFPVRLTIKTRESVEDGMYHSFVRFVQDLHSAVLLQHDGNSVTGCDVDIVVEKIANALTLESCRVLDGHVTACEARTVCISYIEKCRVAAVRKQSAEMESLDRACAVVIETLARFGRTATQIGKGVVVRMRGFLKSAERKGLRAAAQRLGSERQLRGAMTKHSWLLGGKVDDDKVSRIYELLLVTHNELAQTLTWQRRRVAWLSSANSANRCWCGLAVDTGFSGGLLHAPAHMRSFSTSERVRVVLETQEVPFSCYLSEVSVCNVAIGLLDTRRLCLNQISASYSNRIMTWDFAKYETAASRILEDVVRPWSCRMTLPS